MQVKYIPHSHIIDAHAHFEHYNWREEPEESLRIETCFQRLRGLNYGSVEERMAVETASRYGSKPMMYPFPSAKDVTVEIIMEGAGPRMGGDAKLSLVLQNRSSVQRNTTLLRSKDLTQFITLTVCLFVHISASLSTHKSLFNVHNKTHNSK
ncbi:transglutaminase 1 like 4 [Triplophysa rosa]|uniref:transglutaminase 1 like 4 n=1 Tax=Triplophysa rosa TaxID=992332 RepID=UPI0025460253|nr:transglutaminase 1 like 4 [Triplophysa rosa]